MSVLSVRRGTATALALALAPLATALPSAAETPGDTGARHSSAPDPGTPERSATTRLADRRSLVVGDRLYQMGTEDGLYPATGFHTRGEMGGFWTPPVKLLDGIWFRAGGSWLTARRYTSGWGYQQMDLGTHAGVRVTRTDFAPDGLRAGLVGLRLDSPRATTLSLDVDAHSELMKVYPWGETTPSQTDYNLPDTGSVDARGLVFRERGTPPVPHGEAHDYAAVVGSRLTPTGTRLGPDHRGPQDPAVVCPASGPSAPPAPDRCDDTAYGQGTGGRLSYRVRIPAGGRTVWFAVAGSDRGLRAAKADRDKALAHPRALLREVTRDRVAVASRTRVNLPGDPLLERSVLWSKQNLAESVQEARHLKVRVTNAGTRYPAPKGTVDKIRWLGAGWPDYPWLFATDGEYTAFAAVAAGQFRAIEDHLRALRDVSRVANGRSGKIVHEVTPDGQVYFGAKGDDGNTDETAKFASTVALVWRWTGDDRFRDSMYRTSVRAMHYIYRELDADHDGWPEGLGNVERDGMGQEKLDNSVYTLRGLRDLADLARSKDDRRTQRWATTRAQKLQRKFERTWWFGPTAHQYADSLADPGNEQVFQRHWIGLTPVEAELTLPNGRTRPVAARRHARRVVAGREKPCYSGEFGLFHTGTGATGDPAGNPGATCDTATSSVVSERSVFTLNTSIMAVAEAALGRLGADQLQRYTTANARVQLDPSVWELPGAMPEISPSPDFGANIDKPLTERSMALQAWGTYGILWPVVHHELGVTPDMGRNRLRVVPQVPGGQRRISGRDIRVGRSHVDVRAVRGPHALRTVVDAPLGVRLTLGAVLPKGAHLARVRLDGERTRAKVVHTSRGREVWVQVSRVTRIHRLRVTLR